MKVASLIFLILVSVFIVILSISNKQLVELSLWPFFSGYELPLYVVILVNSFFAFLLGGCYMWIVGLNTRVSMRAAKKRAKALEKELADVNKKQNNEQIKVEQQNGS